MAIGRSWRDASWDDNSWEIGSWEADVSVAAIASSTGVSGGIGIWGLVLLLGRALMQIGEWW